MCAEPLLLQAGVAKSGNFWLWKIVEQIQLESGVQPRTFVAEHPIQGLARTWPLSQHEQSLIDVLDIDPGGVFFRISSIFRYPVEDLADYLRQTNHVWTHSPAVKACWSVFSRFDRRVYIVRDPRDVVLSAARFQFTPYMQQFHPSPCRSVDEYLKHTLPRFLRYWAQHVVGYLRMREAMDIHFVFFERLRAHFVPTIEALAQYLRAEVPTAAWDRIEVATSLQSMRLTNPEHVRAGQYGGWVEALNADQKRLVLRRVGGLLDFLGYPLSSRSVQQVPPAEPPIPTHRQLEEFEHALRPRFLFWKRVKKYIRRGLSRRRHDPAKGG